jgi:hypothetical protein
MVDPWGVVTEIRECPPSTLKNIDDTPREVVTEIRECPPSMLKNVDGGPVGGGAGGPGAPTTQF